MASYLKNIVKSTLVGLAVGVALSVILPVFAASLGIPEAAGALGNAAWTGGFVALISGTTAALQPTFDRLFGDAPRAPAMIEGAEKTPEKAQAVEQNISCHKTPGFATAILEDRTVTETAQFRRAG